MTVDPPLERPVFAVDGEEVLWRDVVAAARAWGEWEAVEVAAARCDAALASPASTDESLRRAVEERATDFRYAHRLLSADETADWFAGWGISVDAWLRHLQGSVLAGQLTESMTAEPAPESAWIEGVVSGTLQLSARRLAEGLALTLAAGSTTSPDLQEIDTALREFEQATATPAALARAVAAHRLHWTEVELLAVDVADEGAAREFLYCIQEDRRPIEAVAREAAVPVERVRAQLEDLPDAMRWYLSSAQPGDVLGPIPLGAEFRVVVVTARVEPDPEEGHAGTRARGQVVAEALRRECGQRVTWLDSAAVASAP